MDCENRHRRKCKYYTSKQGCFREDDGQYLHKKGQKENSTQGHQYKDVEEPVDSFKCEHWSFKSTRMITLKKHITTKHEDTSIMESVSTFIFRLGLEDFAHEYEEYFKRYGFTRGEAQHVEKFFEQY